MSFILDALRKSERERQSRRAPGIADMRRAETSKKRSIWLPLAALLAGLNVALLALLWYSADHRGSPAPVAAAPDNFVRPAGSRPTVGSRDRDLSQQLAEEVFADEVFADQEPDEAAAEPARYAAIAPPSAVAQPAAADIEIPPAPAPARTRMPTVTEAIMDGSLNIKPLHLDIHVYSDKPAERFVFINTARYGEGDRTSEGPTVATINPDGVVLSYQGRSYLLARE